MKYRAVTPGSEQEHSKTAMGRRSVEWEIPVSGLVSGEKPNQCIIFPVSTNMVAEALERTNENWIVRTKAASDLIVLIGDSSFHLHRLPMVSKSGYLNRVVFQRRSNIENRTSTCIQIDDLPGGPEIFELVVKFCYGWKVDVVASNVGPLLCAASFLEMSDDLEPENLISKTESFLSFIILTSWKETFQIFKSCESISSWAKDLQIPKRCSEAVAWKACINPKMFHFKENYAQCLNFLVYDIDNSKVEDIADNWWFEDVSALQIDHFIEVIESIKTKGMKSQLVGSCIAHWTSKWLPRITLGLDNQTPKHLSQQLLRVTTESLIRILPAEENSVSCNFLLNLFKLGLMMKVNCELSNKLEKRLAFLLEHFRAPDLLVKNYGENDTVYDVGIIIKVVKSCASSVLGNSESRMFAVGKLVDGFLTLVARDKNLTVQNFQSLIEALPRRARYCNDKLYRAIDMYLKAHPNLTEEERTSVTRAMEFHKLSQEARQHVMINTRLPLKTTTQFILLEKVNTTMSMTAAESNYRRSMTHEKGWMASQHEIRVMKKEVETMKVQLNKLQMCKQEIQRQARRCITGKMKLGKIGAV